jgi:hypothetical protein
MNSAVDRAVEAMRRANPVPDPIVAVDSMQRPEDFLASTKEMSMSIDTSTPAHTEPDRRPRTPRRSSMSRLVAAAAFAVVALAGLIVVLNRDGGIPLAGAEDDPQAQEAFEAVEAAYAAYNNGDAAWLEIRNRTTDAYYTVESSWAPVLGADPDWDRARDDHLLRVFEANRAAGSRYDVIGCRSYGEATWDTTDQGMWSPADQEGIVGHRFTCDAVLTDAFRGASNLSLAESFEWVVADGEVVDVNSVADLSTWWAYTIDFRGFMFSHHRDVAGDISYVSFSRHPEGSAEIPSAESMPLVLEYVDEFARSRQ